MHGIILFIPYAKLKVAILTATTADPSPAHLGLRIDTLLCLFIECSMIAPKESDDSHLIPLPQ